LKKMTLFLSILFLAIVFSAGAAVQLTESAEFCGSCHIMTAHYETWAHSSHREETNCNSCHVPEGLIEKPLYKAKSGLTDAYVFYIKGSPARLELKTDSRKIIQNNCIKCHSTLVREISKGDGLNCYHCHLSPHGKVKNLIY